MVLRRPDDINQHGRWLFIPETAVEKYEQNVGIFPTSMI